MSDADTFTFRSPELLNRDDSRLLIVDMQEKVLNVIPGSAAIIEHCRLLARGAAILGVPVSTTEQYPRGLGSTTPALADLLGDVREKLRFSSAAAVEWGPHVGDGDRPKVVVAGIEAHVCVQQTVLDLLAGGFSVYVAADAVCSRHEVDATIALQRMRDSGATVTTAEAILFEWCEVAGTDEFKQISRLVKDRDAGRNA
jgi:nicotinamidase-related amidase